MVIGGIEKVMNKKLSVNEQSIEHKIHRNRKTDILEENLDGKVEIENVEQQKFLESILPS